MSTLHQINSRRLDWAELVRLPGSPHERTLRLLAKGLGIRTSIRPSRPPLRSLHPLAMPLAAWPTAHRNPVEQIVAQLSAVGFTVEFSYHWRDLYASTHFAGVWLSHPDDRRTVAWVTLNPDRGDSAQPDWPATTTFLTTTASGRRLLSTNGPLSLSWPKQYAITHETSLDASNLWAFHLTRSRTADGTTVPADPHELHAEWFDFQQARGVLVPRLDGWTELTRALLEADEVDGLIQVMRAQNRAQEQLTSRLLTFSVSALLFLALGAAVWTFEFAVLLIPVLVVHELGHLLAMRRLGYTNLGMFLIPLVGAAATGQPHEIAGWRQSIVALAGPIFGFLVGIGVGVVGLQTGMEWLVAFAMVSLLINGLNLLPILPLDGGGVVNALWTARHPRIDLFTRSAAVVLLAMGAWWTHVYVLFLPAVLMALTLRSNYRLSILTQQLRESLPTPSATPSKVPNAPAEMPALLAKAADERGLAPRELARRIIAALQRNLPGELDLNALTQQTGSVLKELQMRPPRLRIGLAFAGVHLATFAGVLLALRFYATTDGGKWAHLLGELLPR